MALMMAARTILMIEDDATHARHLIRACAERFADAAVMVAGTGEEAVALLDGGLRPAAILLDLTLPAMSGYDLLETLRGSARFRPIPVIVFTVDQSDAARHLCERLGASAIHVKPTSRTGFQAFATFLQTALDNGSFAEAG